MFTKAGKPSVCDWVVITNPSNPIINKGDLYQIADTGEDISVAFLEGDISNNPVWLKEEEYEVVIYPFL